MKTPPLLPIALLFALATSGCGAKSAPPARDAPPRKQGDLRNFIPHQDPPDAAPLPAGAMTQALDELYRLGEENKTLEACDLSQRSIRYEVARLLDDHSQKILKRFEARDTTKDGTDPAPVVTFQTVGPLTMRMIPEPNPKPENRWNWSKPKSWQGFYSDALLVKQKIAEKNSSASDRAIVDYLANLDFYVRSFYFDELKRVEGKPHFFNHADDRNLEKLISTLEKCETDSTCESPDWDTELETFLARVPRYRPLTRKISRAALVEFIKIVKYDYDAFFKLFPYDDIRRIANDTIEVPINPKALAEISTNLGEWIESTWKSDRLKVKVKWTTDPNPFSIEFFADRPGRDSVSWERRTLNLFNYTDQKTIVHEFGHVLGLRDEYYTIWDPSECDYQVESNPANLMSEHETGGVTPEMFQKLEEAYPIIGSDS